MKSHQKELTFSGSRFELRPSIVSDPAKPIPACVGLKLPDLSFWEFLKLTPEELRKQLSAKDDP